MDTHTTPQNNGIELNRRDINIRQVYVTIRHITSESDENYKNTYDLNGIELGIRLEKRN